MTISQERHDDIQAKVLVILSNAMGQTLPTGYAARRLTEWFSQELEAAEARATTAEAERDKLRGLLEDLGRDLLDVTAERDALQAKVDAALALIAASYHVTLPEVRAALTDPPKAEPERDQRPHSRACGWRWHPHGNECSSDCPTCGPPAQKQPEADYGAPRPSLLPCRLGRIEYDGDQYCFEHFGFTHRGDPVGLCDEHPNYRGVS